MIEPLGERQALNHARERLWHLQKLHARPKGHEPGLRLMTVKLTPLQSLNGRIVLSQDQEGWRVEEEGSEVALGDAVRVGAGSYEARGRATTTQPGRGVGFAREVYVFDSDAELRAVKAIHAEFRTG